MSSPLANLGGQKDAAATSDSTKPEVKEGTAGGQPNATNLDDDSKSIAGGESAPGAGTPSLGGGDPDPVAKTAEERKESESDVDSGTDNNVVYSSHPTKRFSLGGRWQFDNSILSLAPDEAVEFDKVLDAQPMVIRRQVKKLDPSIAHEVGRKALEKRGIRGIDTTANGEPSPEAPVS